MVKKTSIASVPLMPHASTPHRTVRYFSFDVFDTCVTRYCINPPDLFESLFTHLLRQQETRLKLDTAALGTAARALARSRIQAESNARSQVASDDVALAKIYQTLAPSLQAYGVDPADALAEEIELELAAVSPILSTQKRIQKLRAEGHIIVFISDMYLPGSVVRQMLIEHRFSDGSDGVYVSADIGFSKGSGRLFTYVCNQLGISPKQLHHTGDNAYADIRAAQQLGIRTTYFTQGDPTVYEQGFRSELIGNDWMRSYLIGLSRAVRLRHDSGVIDTHQHATLAADILAPLLTSYTLWVLTTARQFGICQLYFAEEGLFAIAQVILHQWQQQTESLPLAGKLPTCYLQPSPPILPAQYPKQHTALVGFETGAGENTSKTEAYNYTFSLLGTAEQIVKPSSPNPFVSPANTRHFSYLEAPIAPYPLPEGTLYLFEYRQVLQRLLQVVGTATLPIYRTIVLDYAVSLTKQCAGSNHHAMIKQYATRNAIDFLASPTAADVNAFTNLQLAIDSPSVVLMAKPVHLLSLPAFGKQFLKGRQANTQSRYQRWNEGSIAISPYAVRFILMNLRRIYRKLVQYLSPWRGKKIL